MMDQQLIRVFIASPGDVAQERNALEKLVTELNLTISAVAPEKRITLELVRWETHSFPSAGRPQGVINDQIGAFDIFVGVMWQRFGTPTGEAKSGTEEEFNRAYERWEQEGKPQLMFYFCQAPAAPPQSVADAEQVVRVAAFRDRLSKKALVWEYHDHSEFPDVVRPHLLRVLAQSLRQETPDKAPSTVTAGEASTIVRDQLSALIAEYTSIRTQMSPSDARTRHMELIVTRMRTLAMPGYSLLDSFVHAKQPGERLAAIAMLQVLPNADYLVWLGERLSESQPFIEYHAAVALLTSARTLECGHSKSMAQAIRDGMTRLGDKRGTDRYRVLTSALQELDARCPEK